MLTRAKRKNLIENLKSLNIPFVKVDNYLGGSYFYYKFSILNPKFNGTTSYLEENVRKENLFWRNYVAFRNAELNDLSSRRRKQNRKKGSSFNIYNLVDQLYFQIFKDNIYHLEIGDSIFMETPYRFTNNIFEGNSCSVEIRPLDEKDFKTISVDALLRIQFWFTETKEHSIYYLCKDGYIIPFVETQNIRSEIHNWYQHVLIDFGFDYSAKKEIHNRYFQGVKKELIERRFRPENMKEEDFLD